MRTNSRHPPCLTWRAELPSRPARLAWVRQSLAVCLLHPTARIPARQHANIILTVHELVLNSMTHARPSPVHLSWTIAARSVVCVIQDRGGPIVWPRSAMLPDARQTSGRGLWLAQQCCHRVRYRRTRGMNIIHVEWQWQ